VLQQDTRARLGQQQQRLHQSPRTERSSPLVWLLLLLLLVVVVVLLQHPLLLVVFVES
jgi:predicted nucleic acid-binding Zn ribbon protein